MIRLIKEQTGIELQLKCYNERSIDFFTVDGEGRYARQIGRTALGNSNAYDVLVGIYHFVCEMDQLKKAKKEIVITN
jgi:hypothetical protein